MTRPSEELAGLIEQPAIDFDCSKTEGAVGLPETIQISQAISLARIAAACERVAAAEEARNAATTTP